jgi:hypothetical protein
MKKIFSLFLIASALILGSCEKDTITTYVTQESTSISARFKTYEDDPGGTTIDTTRGLIGITLTGGTEFVSSAIAENGEVELEEGTIYTVIWSYYDTSNVLQSLSATFSLNYINDPNSISIYLGDDNSEVIRVSE